MGALAPRPFGDGHRRGYRIRGGEKMGLAVAREVRPIVRWNWLERGA